MLIGKSELAKLIPHVGAMCLLDGVLRWDATSIRCVATSHRDRRNPLGRDGRLPAVSAIEYASQAMAAHGRLAGAVGEQPRAGYLASLRNVVLRTEYLNDLDGDLVVDAEKLLGEELRVLYQFSLSCDGVELVTGRAAVVLDAGKLDAGTR